MTRAWLLCVVLTLPLAQPLAVACRRPLRLSVRRHAAPCMPMRDDITPDDVPDMGDDSLEKDLSATLQMKEFNNELYAHLNQRPEYETSELYSQLRKRQDVDDPLYSELEKRREMLSNAPLPNEEQTPGEVIELVLRALRDVDWPRAGHGVEILQSYSGPGSILGENRPEVTAQMLQDYFEASKYGILLDWVAIQYLRKLELCECSCRHTAYGLECVRSSPLTFALSRSVFFIPRLSSHHSHGQEARAPAAAAHLPERRLGARHLPALQARHVRRLGLAHRSASRQDEAGLMR